MGVGVTGPLNFGKLTVIGIHPTGSKFQPFFYLVNIKVKPSGPLFLDSGRKKVWVLEEFDGCFYYLQFDMHTENRPKNKKKYFHRHKSIYKLFIIITYYLYFTNFIYKYKNMLYLQNHFLFNFFFHLFLFSLPNAFRMVFYT